MQVLKQVINENDLVCVASKDQLNTKFWKKQNIKSLDRYIDQYKEKRAQSMELMPYFELVVVEHEIKWKTNRRRFNVIQRSTVSKVFRKRYKDKIIEIWGEVDDEELFKR